MSFNYNQAYSSKTVEWYTPPKYLEAARHVLGGIDLDPASNPVANRMVKATRFYTREDDGLALPWFGRVWLNPPFNESRQWSTRLIAQYRDGNVSQAILLVKFVPSYQWFQPLKQFPFVATDHRVSFLRPDGTAGENRLDVSIAFVYFGDHANTFLDEFGQFGHYTLMRRVGHSLCKSCGSRLPELEKGRTRHYCSDACRMKAYRQRHHNERKFQ